MHTAQRSRNQVPRPPPLSPSGGGQGVERGVFKNLKKKKFLPSNTISANVFLLLFYQVGIVGTRCSVSLHFVRIPIPNILPC